MDKNLKKLKEQYKCKGFKQGTSLQILVDVDKVLKQEQLDEYNKAYGGRATIEELYELYHLCPAVKKEGLPHYIPLSDLERCISAIEKYLTKKEAKRLQKLGPKYPIGALAPTEN